MKSAVGAVTSLTLTIRDIKNFIHSNYYGDKILEGHASQGIFKFIFREKWSPDMTLWFSYSAHNIATMKANNEKFKNFFGVINSINSKGIVETINKFAPEKYDQIMGKIFSSSANPTFSQKLCTTILQDITREAAEFGYFTWWEKFTSPSCKKADGWFSKSVFQGKLVRELLERGSDHEAIFQGDDNPIEATNYHLFNWFKIDYSKLDKFLEKCESKEIEISDTSQVLLERLNHIFKIDYDNYYGYTKFFKVDSAYTLVKCQNELKELHDEYLVAHQALELQASAA